MMYAGTRGGYSDWGWAEFSGVVVLGVAGMIAGIYWVYDGERR